MSAIETLDAFRKSVTAGAESRYEEFYNCHAEWCMAAPQTCLPTAIAQGQRPDAALVMSSGVDAVIFNELGIPPGSSFGITHTSPYLLPYDQLGNYPHATWAGLEYARNVLRVPKIIMIGSNDCFFGDPDQFGGPARAGATVIREQVESFAQAKGIKKGGLVTELTARRMLVESVNNIQAGFKDALPEEIVAEFHNHDKTFSRLNVGETIAQTYADMVKDRHGFGGEVCLPVDVLFGSCADSRKLAQHFMCQHRDDILFNNSVAAIIPPYEASLDGMVHPWKLIKHAAARRVQVYANKGHEGCGGAEALVKYVISDGHHQLPPLVQNWVLLAHDPVARIVEHARQQKIITGKFYSTEEIGIIANMAARAITVWGLANVKARYPALETLALHAQKNGSLLELNPKDPLGLESNILFESKGIFSGTCLYSNCGDISHANGRASVTSAAIERKRFTADSPPAQR